jgi:hypothetical protein
MGLIEKVFAKIIRKHNLNQLVERTYRNLSLVPNCIGVTNDNFADVPVVVSLTSYNKRIFDVFLTIESIFQQTQKANRVLLWLDKDEFTNDVLPIKLKSLVPRGLEIKYCENIKSYKKLVPTLNECQNHIIITVDDDVIYPDDFIENLMRVHRQSPHMVHCYRARNIAVDSSRDLKHYKNWKVINKNIKPSFSIIPNGVGGVLYPPNCFHPDVTRQDLFMAMAPKGDDLWFKTMTVLNGVQSSVVPIECPFFEKFIVIEAGQDIALYHSKISASENDFQMAEIMKHYNLKGSHFCNH